VQIPVSTVEEDKDKFAKCIRDSCGMVFLDGSSEDQYIKEVCVCQPAYDAFQNVSCHAISHSKLTCNTNVAAIMHGPIGEYSFKYHLKGTQKDDTEEYE
jgi:hypothetical protein